MNASALDARTTESVDSAPPLSERSYARPSTAVLLTTASAVLMAGALALSNRNGLWLDEAQSVAIARLPLGDALDALRQDGAPPLYYILLHGWMKVFGEGALAVRTLSAVFATATVPMTLLAARPTIGRRGALVAGGLMATVPFLYRYGTETRMYTLVALLVATGWWLAATKRHVPLAIVAGLLLLTHYWAFFLVLATFGLLVWMRWWRTAASIAAGGLLFVPWVPTFLYQVAHTGAPWARPARLNSFDSVLAGFGGGAGRVNILALLYFAIATLAVRHSEVGRRLAVATVVPLAVGFGVSALTTAAFADRYAAIVLLPFVLLVAAGIRHVGTRRTATVLLAVMAVSGLVNGGKAAFGQRTQAPAMAEAINEGLKPDDRVVICPDQLGPSLKRLLSDRAQTVAYPLRDSGEIVNWVDYRDRNRNADPIAFGRQIHAETPGSIWVVHGAGYRTFGRQCTTLVEELRRLRPGDERIVHSKRSSFERGTLWKFRERD